MSTRELSLILKLRDEASAQLKTFNTNLESMRPQLQKMAGFGTAAFAGIAAGAGVAVSSAAKAEVSWAAFDKTFGDSADQMREWVDDVRQDMPKATFEIAKSSTMIGGMLKGMGFAEQEAAEFAKGMLDLAAAQAAFTGEDPTQVLSTLQSALRGSQQSADIYGLSVGQNIALEAAVRAGIIDSVGAYDSLSEAQKRQVMQQARLASMTEGSAAAFAALDAEKETLAFKMRDLRVQGQELSATIGAALIPPVLSLVEAISPVIQRISAWAEENPQLIKGIIIAGLAISGLVAVLGTLGLVILAVSPAIAAISIPMLLITGIIAGLIVIGVLLWKNWDFIKERALQIWGSIADFFVGIWEWIKNIFNLAIDFIANLVATAFGFTIMGMIYNNWGAIRDFFITTWATITETFSKAKDQVLAIWETIKNAFKSAADFIWDNTFKRLFGWIDNLLSRLSQVRDGIASVGGRVGSAVKGAVGKVGGFISNVVPFAKGGIVTQPTMGLVGEAGAEAIIPLDRFDKFGTTVNVHITGNSFMGEDDMAEKVGDKLIRLLKQNTRLTNG